MTGKEIKISCQLGSKLHCLFSFRLYFFLLLFAILPLTVKPSERCHCFLIEFSGTSVEPSLLYSPTAFNTTAAQAGEFDEDIEAHVKMLYFIAGRSGNKKPQLQWATATEKRNALFLIERSEDNRNWTAVGEVEAAGNSETQTNYGWTDSQAQQGISFYRLRQIDEDGNSTYSEVTEVEISSNNSSVPLASAASVFAAPSRSH